MSQALLLLCVILFFTGACGFVMQLQSALAMQASKNYKSRDIAATGAQYVTVLRRKPTTMQDPRSRRSAAQAYKYQETPLEDLGPEYVGSIGVGTVRHCTPSLAEVGQAEKRSCQTVPQQSLSVVFDTGSTNMWMASTLCRAGPCASEERHRYDPARSETYTVPSPPRTLKSKFGTAELAGPLGTDYFHIGPFTVKNLTFGLIEESWGDTFNEYPIEGIVGLGFPSLSAHTTSAFFDTVIKQKVLKRNLFCIYFPANLQEAPRNQLHGGQSLLETASGVSTGLDLGLGSGAILWGGYDEHLFEGPLMWFPVTQAHYWSIDLHGFYYGNQSVNVEHASPEVRTGELGSNKLIFDTGTTYYAAAGRTYAFLEKHLPTVACDSEALRDEGVFRNLTFQLKDVNGNMHNLVLTPEDYMVSGKHDKCELAFMDVGPPPQYGPAMIVGELFMQRYFTVFDRGNGSDTDARIGFAKGKS